MSENFIGYYHVNGETVLNLKQFRPIDPYYPKYAGYQYYKALSVYSAFKGFNGISPQLSNKSKPFEVLEKTEYKSLFGPVIQYTAIEGESLEYFLNRGILEAEMIREIFLNTVLQLEYIYNNTQRPDNSKLPYFHGDIHPGQVIIHPDIKNDLLTGCLIDWDLVSGGNIDFMIPTLLLSLFSPEELEEFGFDSNMLLNKYGKLPESEYVYYQGDLYSLTLVISASLIGLEAFYRIREESGGIIDFGKVVELLGPNQKALVSLIKFGLEDIIYSDVPPQELITKYKELLLKL